MVDENETTGIISKNIPELVSTPLREDLIATAVKFLQNPKVQSSPIQQKRDFMKKKGNCNNAVLDRGCCYIT